MSYNQANGFLFYTIIGRPILPGLASDAGENRHISVVLRFGNPHHDTPKIVFSGGNLHAFN